MQKLFLTDQELNIINYFFQNNQFPDATFNYFSDLLEKYHIPQDLFQKIYNWFENFNNFPTTVLSYLEETIEEATLNTEQVAKIIEHVRFISIKILNKYPTLLDIMLKENYDLMGYQTEFSKQLVEYIDQKIETWCQQYYVLDLVRCEQIPDFLILKILYAQKDDYDILVSFLRTYCKVPRTPHKIIYQFYIKKYTERAHKKALNFIHERGLDILVPLEYLELHHFLKTERLDLAISGKLLLQDFSFLLTCEKEIIRTWVKKQLQQLGE